MKQILIVHHSASGGTHAMIGAFCDGANDADSVAVITRSANIATAQELQRADALILATPENFGYMAGSLKEFFDRTFYACMADTTQEGATARACWQDVPIRCWCAQATTVRARCKALIASSPAGACVRRIQA